MEIEFLSTIASLGVGAVFGIVIFLIYRYDRKNSEKRLREDRRFMEDRLTKLLEQDQEARRENTKALTELKTYLLIKNGKMKG